MIVDITTWCSPNNRAANSLKKILEETGNEKLVKQIGIHLSGFAKLTKHIQDIKHSGTRDHVMTIMYKIETEKIKKKKYPKDIESHLRNVISTMYKTRK